MRVTLQVSLQLQCFCHSVPVIEPETVLLSVNAMKLFRVSGLG